MYRKLVAPIVVQWEITPACNHNCVHCYNHWRDDKNFEKLNKNYQVLNQTIVNELISNKVFRVIITGGEPLMVINEFASEIERLSNSGILVSLNSNLALLNEENVKVLIKCGIKSILVSLPSSDPLTCDLITGNRGSFERIKQGILLAKEAGFKIFTNMVVSKYNKNQITETAKFVQSIGLKNFSATRASDPSSNREFLANLLDINEFRLMQEELNLIKKNLNISVNSLEANPVCSYGEVVPVQGYKFCNAGKSTCTISFDGDIRPCNRLIMTYGNINEGLLNVWNRMDEWRSNNLIPNICSDCKLSKKCLGGCKADAFKNNKDIYKEDPLCDPKRIKFINSNDITEDPVLTNKTFFIVNKDIFSRLETFGWLLSTQNASSLVSFELGDFILNNQIVTLDRLQEILHSEKDITLATASALIKKHILMEAE